jgi:hypothetical protein
MKRRLFERRSIIAREDVILGMRVLRVTLPLSGRIDVAAELLRNARVSRLCFAYGFPYRELFLSDGFREADGDALLPKLAETLSGSGKTAALTAPRAGTVETRTLKILCERNRYVTAAFERGGARAIAELQRRLGVSVLAPGARAADFTVAFGRPPPEIAFDGLPEPLSERFPKASIVAAALTCGAIGEAVLTLRLTKR